MSNSDYIDDSTVSTTDAKPTADDNTTTTQAEPEMDQVVITMPAKLKRALIALLPAQLCIGFLPLRRSASTAQRSL
ncbi:MAG: hypothetical protein II281_05725, partial [Alistipes sp.]|nr:hypothetical protein [Alistipes sp.]